MSTDSDGGSNDSTVSMIENQSIGVPENESNITNNENFLEPNTLNLDDVETVSMPELNVCSACRRSRE